MQVPHSFVYVLFDPFVNLLSLQQEASVMANHIPELLLPAAAEPAVVLVIDADEGLLLTSINQKLRDHLSDPRRLQPYTIYRVRESIRKEDPGAYDPQIIAIGPYHHDNPLLQPMERLKKQFLLDLISRQDRNPVEKYIKELSTPSFVAEAKKCYAEPSVCSYATNDFVEMMLFDGCFIIEFLVKSFLGEDMGELDYVNWNRALMENDLLLLENQIPFTVLETLFNSSSIPGIQDISNPLTLKDFVASTISRDRMDNLRILPNVVHHLLHLRHSSLAPATKTDDSSKKPWTCRSVTHQILYSIQHLLSHTFFWMLSVLLTWRRPPRYEPSPKAPRTTPTATELREAGIKFRIKKTSCLLDVTFRKRDGVIEMPRLPIQALTLSQFRNLVAFEQCCPTAGSHFTSYVALMDNLIDDSKDVALLERSGVLESKLGGDDEVASFFNNLGKGAHLNYDSHYLVGLFKDVTEYCAIERHRWRARMVHDYFGNPWSTISVIAAFVLLLLTFTQTLFTVLEYSPKKEGS